MSIEIFKECVASSEGTPKRGIPEMFSARDSPADGQSLWRTGPARPVHADGSLVQLQRNWPHYFIVFLKINFGVGGNDISRLKVPVWYF